MSNKTGQPGAWLQPSAYWRNETGAGATVPYESVNADDVNAIAVDCDRLKLSYRVTHSFGKHRIEVDYSYNPEATETPEDVWEYHGREVPKDVLQAATNTGITATLSPANISVIRAAINGTFPKNSPKDGNDVQYIDASANSFADGKPTDANLIYHLMKSGMSDYLVVAPTLQHTQTVSSIYPILLSQANVGKLISNSTLALQEPTMPAFVFNGLPNILPPSFSDGKQFAFAWFKHSPTIHQAAFKKFQIVQEYEYGIWPTSLYGQPL